MNTLASETEDVGHVVQQPRFKVGGASVLLVQADRCFQVGAVTFTILEQRGGRPSRVARVASREKRTGERGQRGRVKRQWIGGEQRAANESNFKQCAFNQLQTSNTFCSRSADFQASESSLPQPTTSPLAALFTSFGRLPHQGLRSALHSARHPPALRPPHYHYYAQPRGLFLEGNKKRARTARPAPSWRSTSRLARSTAKRS